MAKSKSTIPAPKAAVTGDAAAAKPSSTTAVAASAAAAGAAGGENAGTNTSSAPDGREVVTKPQAGDSSPAAQSEPRDGSAEMEHPPTGGDEAAVIALVRSRHERGFWRAGRFWTHEATAIRDGELNDEQLAALRAEPLLLISDIND